MDSFRIVSITEQALEDCARVIREGFATVAVDFGLTKDNCPTNGAFLTVERLQSQYLRGNRMFGLYADGKLCGFTELSRRDNNRFELEKLTVLPTLRHRGYGDALLNHAVKAARSLGAERLTIGIIEENLQLKNWYLSKGFIHTGTAVFPHLPFTVGFMELRLYSAE